MKLLTDDIVGQLNDNRLVLKTVGAAATMKPIESPLDETPAAMVFLVSAIGPQDAPTTSGTQRRVHSYGLHIVVADHGDLQPVLDELDVALSGWQPPGGGSWGEMAFSKIELQNIESGMYWYTQEWRIENWV